ncbi:MAG: type 4a pilus biogenesis protein PilO [Gammaproteobacteria bacterium]|nr:type 4a pilus biogenesis protein PilO [Gammaproteobacteria bacterium]
MNVSDLNNLDFNNIGSWPMAAKGVAIAVICAAVLFAGYWFDTKEQMQMLEQQQAKENELKQTFEKKQADAANLEAYKEQMAEMEKRFGALLLKLPSKTEIAELLVDVSRVGLDAGLEFELFKPGNEVPRDFYAEFPINLRVKGSYHELGNFVSGVAALPRIVTIHDLSMKKDKEGELTMTATANTYRYLDKSETKPKSKSKSKKRR